MPMVCSKPGPRSSRVSLGPWEAEGRSDIPFEDMLRLDYSYVVGWSMGEDFLRLLLRNSHRRHRQQRRQVMLRRRLR